MKRHLSANRVLVARATLADPVLWGVRIGCRGKLRWARCAIGHVDTNRGSMPRVWCPPRLIRCDRFPIPVALVASGWYRREVTHMRHAFEIGVLGPQDRSG